MPSLPPALQKRFQEEGKDGRKRGRNSASCIRREKTLLGQWGDLDGDGDIGAIHSGDMYMDIGESEISTRPSILAFCCGRPCTREADGTGVGPKPFEVLDEMSIQ